MKHLLLLLLSLSLCLAAKAQGESAVKVSEGGYGLVRTNLSVEYEHSWEPVSAIFKDGLQSLIHTGILFPFSSQYTGTTGL